MKKSFIYLFCILSLSGYSIAQDSNPPSKSAKAESNESLVKILQAMEPDNNQETNKTLVQETDSTGIAKQKKQSQTSSLSLFIAQPGDRRVALAWATEWEKDVERIFLERSLDQTVFTVITEFQPKGNHQNEYEYHFTDGMVRNGVTYFYRLTTRDSDGSITHYRVIKTTPHAIEAASF